MPRWQDWPRPQTKPMPPSSRRLAPISAITSRRIKPASAQVRDGITIYIRELVPFCNNSAARVGGVGFSLTRT